jgi:protein O-mannosyl-transferase
MRPADWNPKRLAAVVAGVLAVATFALYLPSLRDNFINFDDPEYIINNPHVNSGLSWANIVWAFTRTHADYWVPLTWLSHMLDCQWFGLHPAGHHLVSLLFHMANSVLLFFWLNQLTGATWRSALVAALFAWHPLRVESVAWAAERKDVLCAFFWMLTLLAYTRHVTSGKWRVTRTESRPATILSPVTCHLSPYYFLALFFFACGLMSKPMIVTLPFVLLLIDFWPLQRFSLSAFRFPLFRRLLAEKIPFFALAAAAGVVTSITAKGAVWFGLPLGFRLANAVISYLRYVFKTFWPVDLAVFYPYPHHWPLGLAVAAALCLALTTVLLVVRARRQPYLLVGWLWFLGTLTPVIGLQQAGLQSMADRFTYLPSIGFFILVVWGVNDLLAAGRDKTRIAALFGAAALTGCLIVTSLQLRYWVNSAILFKHTLDVTRDNYLAEDCLGQTLERIGRTDDALALYADSVRIEPDFPLGRHKLGMMLLEKGRAGEASNHLAAAAQLASRDPVMQYDFGVYLSQHGNPAEAAKYFKAALAIQPDFPEAKRELAKLLAEHPELK